jgi:pimeloyl-ACP methyl ester carboxylesterase
MMINSADRAAAADPGPGSRLQPLSRRRLIGGAAAAGLGAAASVLGGWVAAPGTASAAQLTGASGRPVPVGGGREIWLESSGSGGPVVVLESGYHDGASIWSLDDLLSPAAGPPVFPGLAATNQVIAYYRPGTLDYTTSPPTINTKSSPAPMPRTAADVVADLHTALARARVPAPYVLVAHSLGGLFSRLYAQTHPGQVAGLVLVDSFSTKVPALMGTQWPAYRQLLNFPGIPQDTQPGWEVIDIDTSVAQLAAAPPLRAGMPLVVLSKTEPFPVPAGEKAFSPARLQEAWNQTQDELPALEPGTPHMIATGSDHYIQVREPDLVIAATRLVTGRTRQK